MQGPVYIDPPLILPVPTLALVPYDGRLLAGYHCTVGYSTVFCSGTLQDRVIGVMTMPMCL